MHIRGGENERRTPLFSLVSVSSHFQLILLPNFYLFYFLFLSKTDLISIHPSTHPPIHPPTPPPTTHAPKLSSSFTVYSSSKAESVQSVLGALGSFKQLYLGSKVNTKCPCVEQPTVSVVRQTESPWRENQARVGWRGQAWGREPRWKVASI